MSRGNEFGRGRLVFIAVASLISVSAAFLYWGIWGAVYWAVLLALAVAAFAFFRPKLNDKPD